MLMMLCLAANGWSPEGVGIAENPAYRLELRCSASGVYAQLTDRAAQLTVADGALVYRADSGTQSFTSLENPSVERTREALAVNGKLGGLDVKQTFTLPSDRPVMEERIVLTNRSDQRIALTALEVGFTRKIDDVAGDRWVAVPLRHRATDPKGYFSDFSTAELLEQPGWEPMIDDHQQYQQLPSRHHVSEGWAWLHNAYGLGIFAFSQECLRFSVVSQFDKQIVRLGGACMLGGEPAALTRIAPGQAVDLGLNRYETVRGGYEQVAYAFRRMLDEQGCRFPRNFNPPVHWEQLYDMEGAWDERATRYTKAALEREAGKGRAYSCEALYLDPGWDTEFASFLWGEWLGPRAQFINEMKSNYGLAVSLHTPLATWMSSTIPMGPSSVAGWPQAALRTAPEGQRGIQMCQGSRAYLDEAEKRLLANCADGVTFLMFDGNWWNGGCNSPEHGHPVPYCREDHIRANLELAQRVHAKYPKVLIEMHDMLAGGSTARPTPVYYKYGLPGSFDENWGFELMWDPMIDLREGRAESLYYYNLACNIPLYLHIDLRKDNRECVVLWWYASTCRHLGIGGTHADPAVGQAQRAALRWYRAHEAYYKRGDFYGLSEDLHAHVLPDEQAFVLNFFNLSDEERTITRVVKLSEVGLAGRARYSSSEPWASGAVGEIRLVLKMPPWSARVAEFEAEPGRR